MHYLVELQTLAPLSECDAVVVVLVAAVEEGCDAVLQRHEWRTDGEQLVHGHESVIVVRVQVTPLPDGGVSPAARQVGLGLALHGQVVRRQLAALSHVAHYVEQPVAHAPREVGHLVLGTFLLCQMFDQCLRPM